MRGKPPDGRDVTAPRFESCDVHGLPGIRWRSRDGASAVATLQGGHLVSWTTPDGRERLFVSERSAYAAGRAIRGGVPVCFPQFADRGPLVQHGFARTLPWRFVGAEEGGGACRATFVLQDSAPTRDAWPHAFRLELAIAIGGATLALELQATNPGDAPFDFTAALHTYFRVDDLAVARLDGLQGVSYLVRGAAARGVEGRARVPAAEPIDRIYFAPPPALALEDGEGSLRIGQEGFTDTVVWNPGREKCAAMGDMAAEGYRHMLCVEAAAIEPGVTIGAGGRWQGRQVIEAVEDGE